MIIAVPVEGKDAQAGVSLIFARAPYIMLYDDAKKEAVWMDNEAAKSQGGAGIRVAQMLIDSGVSVVLAPQCGKNAAAALGAANVRIYRVTQASAMENIEAFLRDELSGLTQIHGGFHLHGGR